MDFTLGACVGGMVVLIIVFLQGIISYDRYNEGYVKGIEIGKKIQLLEMESQGKETEEEAEEAEEPSSNKSNEVPYICCPLRDQYCQGGIWLRNCNTYAGVGDGYFNNKYEYAGRGWTIKKKEENEDEQQT